MSKRRVKMVGIDPSEAILSITHSGNSVVEWRNGKAEAISLAHASLDGVLALLTTHHSIIRTNGMQSWMRIEARRSTGDFYSDA